MFPGKKFCFNKALLCPPRPDIPIPPVFSKSGNLVAYLSIKKNTLPSSTADEPPIDESLSDDPLNSSFSSGEASSDDSFSDDEFSGPAESNDCPGGVTPGGVTPGGVTPGGVTPGGAASCCALLGRGDKKIARRVYLAPRAHKNFAEAAENSPRFVRSALAALRTSTLPELYNDNSRRWLAARSGFNTSRAHFLKLEESKGTGAHVMLVLVSKPNSDEWATIVNVFPRRHKGGNHYEISPQFDLSFVEGCDQYDCLLPA